MKNKKKILMLITDFSSYKTYLDLKNYLYNNNCLDDIDLDYFYFNYTNAHSYHIEKHNTIAHIHLTRQIENEYTNKKYGYVFLYSMFVESLMSVLKNYVAGKTDLLDIDNTSKLYMNCIEWNTTLCSTMTKEQFSITFDNIPHADIYLISDRLDMLNTASITLETALALYLIRKYDSKVFIGGGHFNETNNILVELINAIGREFTNGKLEYLVGTIGINIYNYLKGYEYQNKRSPIERNVLPLNFTKAEMANFFDNSFAIELIRGCNQHCPYCCNSVINKFDRVNIFVYDKYFKYLNEHNPGATIYLYAPELNTNKEYFIKTCEYIFENVKNPLSFYVNIDKIDDEQLKWLLQLNLSEIKFSIDGLFDKTKYRKWDNLSKIYSYLDRLQQLKTEKSINVFSYIVANAPCYSLVDWKNYQDIFLKYHDILQYSEFYLLTSVDYFHNPQKYGISFEYYKNRYKELSAIREVIERVPVLYFREDINRKELINMKYDILRHMKKQIFIDMCGIKQNTSINFILSQMCHVYTYLDLIDEDDTTLDKYITNYVAGVGYKIHPTNNNLSNRLHNIFK